MTMVQPPRRFGSTEHLASEAVAAFVDGELRMAPHLRAAQHLSVCPECAAEVEAQQQARHALRNAATHAPTMPSSLLGALSNIPAHLCDTRPDDPRANDLPGGAGTEMWGASRRWSILRRR
ncbi:MAG: zf-HC2 domain-containing protein [Rhodococcus sp.]|uniref:zf-HC2 domain-containing protein n=1 Tax=Rhodococcus TaxID=1827 RepID=UPI001693E390|nr:MULTISPECIES: zf-HC2 domain-containing protein [Rhodococcus]NLV81130.1 zf-HC2 domain-containing protein [Rhodococcus sp. (in: high G+C Gram-positive bacteria)]